MTELDARSLLVKGSVVKEPLVETWTSSFVTIQLSLHVIFQLVRSPVLGGAGGGFRWVGDCRGETVPTAAPTGRRPISSSGTWHNPYPDSSSGLSDPPNAEPMVWEANSTFPIESITNFAKRIITDFTVGACGRKVGCLKKLQGGW